MELPKPETGKSIPTPSQRLRNVLYLFWCQEAKTIDFEKYYNKTMEKKISYYKNKLI